MLIAIFPDNCHVSVKQTTMCGWQCLLSFMIICCKSLLIDDKCFVITDCDTFSWPLFLKTFNHNTGNIMLWTLGNTNQCHCNCITIVFIKKYFLVDWKYFVIMTTMIVRTTKATLFKVFDMQCCWMVCYMIFNNITPNVIYMYYKPWFC